MLVCSMLVLSSLVLKCSGDKIKKKTAREGRGRERNNHLPIPWKQFIPSDGSLQPCSVIQHFEGSGPVNYSVSKSQPPGLSRTAIQASTWKHSTFQQTAGDVGACWTPHKNQQSPRNCLLQHRHHLEFSHVTWRGRSHAPHTQLYQTKHL